MSTYSFAKILFTSFCGTEPSPGREARGWFVKDVLALAVTVVGHPNVAAVTDSDSPPPRENTGRVTVVPRQEGKDRG